MRTLVEYHGGILEDDAALGRTMGGHGGLNILPQKSWNGARSVCSPAFLLADRFPTYAVYGRENRLKVSRDEAKFEEENKLKRERHVQVPCCPSNPVSLCRNLLA